MPRGADVRPCSHSANAQSSSAHARASFTSSLRAWRFRPQRASAATQNPPTIGQTPPLWYCQAEFCRCRAMYGRQSALCLRIGCTTARTGYGSCTPLASNASRVRRHALAQRAAEHGEHVAEHVAFLAEERKVDEAQVKIAVARAFQHVLVEQARAPVFGEPRREGMEQAVEVRARRCGVRQAEEPFHAIPERVRVQHEARARHDVGPVAGLVLLEQIEALMLLRAEPVKRQRDLAPVTAQQAAAAARCASRSSSRASAMSHHSVESMQPKYQKSASRRSGATNFGIWPFGA